MMTHRSIISETTAVATAVIHPGGRRIGYRGYLIHGEIPAISYAIYGRNALGQLAELGAARSFTAAMRWVDRHLDGMRQDLPVAGIIDEPAEPVAAILRQAA